MPVLTPDQDTPLRQKRRNRLRDMLAACEAQQPDVFALATVASLARSIEPELLRALRLQLADLRARGLPLTVAAESGLWFSSFVESRGADGITLQPEVLHLLRPRLQQQPALFEQARKIIEAAHAAAHAVLQWEEQLVYLALAGEKAAAQLEQQVLRGIGSISSGTRLPLAGWITEMWPRLPQEARAHSLMGRLHSMATGMTLRRTTGPRSQEAAEGDLILDFSRMPMRELGVYYRNGQFIIGDVPEAEFGIQVPDFDPVELDYANGTDSSWHELEPIPRGHNVVINSAQNDLISLRTLAGRIYRLRLPPENIPFEPPHDGATCYVSCEWSNESAQMIDALCHNLETRGIRILRSESDQGPTDRFAKFMSRLGAGDRVLIILSAKYLRSAYCMAELFEVWRNCREAGDEFLRRIYVFRLPDAAMMTPLDRAECAAYWKVHFDDLDQMYKGLSSDIWGVSDHPHYWSMQDFAYRVGDILTLISDRLQPREFGELARDGFAMITEVLGTAKRPDDSPNTAVEPPSNPPAGYIGQIFVGREKFMEELRASMLKQTNAANITPQFAATVLVGLGGLGKTHTAVEYAHRYRDEYTALLFVSADTPQRLQSSLAGLCDVQGLQLNGNLSPEEEARVGIALHWLATHPGWLLIIDNVDDEASAQAVSAHFADLSTGHVLITSRLKHWPMNVDSIDLSVLSPEDATDLLLQLTDNHRRKAADDGPHARTLAELMEGLPLALHQAAGYINEQRCTLTAYLATYKDEASSLLNWFDDLSISYERPDKLAPRPALITWKTSFDKLSAESRHWQLVFSCFASEPIPEFLLDDAPDAGDALKARHRVARQALAQADEFSLITRFKDEPPRFKLHRLTQELTRAAASLQERGEALAQGIQLIKESNLGDPEDFHSWFRWNLLQTHALTLCEHAPDDPAPEGLTWLLDASFLLLKTKFLHAQAEPLIRRALNIDESRFGANHPDVAIRLSNLSGLLRDTNRLVEAESLIRRALQINETSFGPEHPAVAHDLNILAQILQATNRLPEAEQVIRRALLINEASLGPEHHAIAHTFANLAQVLHATSRLEEAEMLMRRALQIDEADFGPGHPNVARHLNNLAQLLQDTHRLAEAEPLVRRALQIDELSFGPDHPAVVRDLNGLAQLLDATNQLEEAKPLLRRALQIGEVTLGTEHPETLKSRNNLANLLHSEGSLAEAEQEHRAVLEIKARVLGAEHPDTLSSRTNLAAALAAQSKHAEAEQEYREVLYIQERVLGTGHPAVVLSQNNLAKLLAEEKRPTEVEPPQSDEPRRRELPPPDTVFKVAFSLATGSREIVRDIAEACEALLVRGSVYFDEWYDHHQVGISFHDRAEEIFEKAQMIVLGVDGSYSKNAWAMSADNVIRGRINRSQTSTDPRDRLSFLPIRIGDGDVPDYLSTYILLDVRERSPDATADIIIRRLAEIEAPAQASVVTQSALPVSQTQRMSGYDVFISYSWKDNSLVDPWAAAREDRWVRCFKFALQERLNYKLGLLNQPLASIFLDAKDIDAGDHLDAEILQALDNTLIFLPLISPWYVHASSPLCKLERDHFKRRLGPDAASQGRIVGVLLDGADGLKIWKEHFFSEVLAFPFFEKNLASETMIRLGNNSVDKNFLDRMDTLAENLCNRIIELRGTVAPAPPPQVQEKGRVFFAAVPGELEEQRSELVNALIAAGWSVFPHENECPADIFACEQWVADTISQHHIQAYVQIVDSNPWMPAMHDAAQWRGAQNIPGIEPMVYRLPDIDLSRVNHKEHRTWLETLSSRSIPQLRADLPAALDQMLVRKREEEVSRIYQIKPEPHTSVFITVSVADADEQAAGQILHDLEKYDVYASIGSKLGEDLEETFDGIDGLLVIYGNEEYNERISSVLNRWRTILAKRRVSRTQAPPFGVLILPPPPEDKDLHLKTLPPEDEDLHVKTLPPEDEDLHVKTLPPEDKNLQVKTLPPEVKNLQVKTLTPEVKNLQVKTLTPEVKNLQVKILTPEDKNLHLRKILVPRMHRIPWNDEAAMAAYIDDVRSFAAGNEGRL